MRHAHRARVDWETREESDPPEGEAAALAEIRTAVQGLTTTVETRVGAIETGVTELRTRLDRAETALRRPGAAPSTNEESAVRERRAFETFIRRGREAMTADELRDLRVSDDTAGGYLAPDQFTVELLRNVVLFSPVRSVARVMPTGGNAVLLPKRTGTMTASWVGETAARSETNVTFGQNRYPVHEIAAYVDVSNAMLEDAAFDVAAELSFEFAEEFGKKEGTAFVSGDGSLKPLGFMSDTGLSSTNSGHASTLTADGLISLYHALPSPYRANAVWGMNATTLGAIRKLKDSNNQYLLAMQGINNAPATTLLGRPIVEMPDLADVAASAYPVVFGDFMQGFRIFDRLQLSILRDPYSQATNGMTRFHARRRVAAGVAKAEAISKQFIAA